MHIDIHDQARGQWRGILMTLGVPDAFLKDKHGPCPMCGGTDRFRWDNKDGKGSFFCNTCGSGSGLDLLMGFKGWDFRTAVDEVRGVLGVVTADPTKEPMPEVKRKKLLGDLWKASRPTERGDVVDRYLTARGVGEYVYPASLRTSDRCYYAEGIEHPAMLGVVVDVMGKPVSLHRTWLGEGCKADVETQRKMMPGEIPEGACIRLGAVQEEIGIAEGIETALAAMQRFELPVWSAIDAGKLAKWKAPEGVRSVCIFGDNDRSFTGQQAAYTLAKRLRIEGVEAQVKIPDTIGTDWADYAKGA
jgi:putative DNA primase/helicase